MADIVGTVFGLALGAQHQLVDQTRMRLLGGARQQRVEIGGPVDLRLRQADTEFSQHFAQFLQFLAVGFVVDTEHRWLAAVDQFARRGDIGGDHEFLD